MDQTKIYILLTSILIGAGVAGILLKKNIVAVLLSFFSSCFGLLLLFALLGSNDPNNLNEKSFSISLVVLICVNAVLGSALIHKKKR